MTEREQIEQAIAHLEAQRALLGDATVDAALAPLRRKLAELGETAHGIARGDSTVDVPAGERKLVTVMFADLSGFTALAERFDPETVREFVNRCFDRLVPVIEGFGGTVDKFIGDEIMALFGAPATHENDPECALRAALAMMSTLDWFNKEEGIDLGMHIGVNTGLVIAGGLGSAGRQQYSVVGDAVNVAARLKDVAEGGTTLVGPDTFRGTKPLFEFEALEPVHVKGKTDPVPVYRLLGFKATPGAMRGIEGLRSPLVGRDAEIGKLREALRAVERGRGGVITLVGEAGLGKSRLVAEARQARRDAVTWAEGRALSYAQDVSYGVARDVLLGLFAAAPDTPPDELNEMLLARIGQLLPQESDEVYPYLAHLLDLPLDKTTAGKVTQLQPQTLQKRLLRAYATFVSACARETPLVLIWEDLHWADPSSLNVLEKLLPSHAEVPLLLLFVLRPEGERVQCFLHRLRESLGGECQSIELQPLDLRESAQLVRNLLEIENLPDEVRRLILDKVEGNPFFLEEVLRSLLDAGLVVFEGDRAVAAHPIQAIDVPDTLRAVIATRIDRLAPTAKRTLQTASVIGRVFQRRVLAAMAQRHTGDDLETPLSELCRREFIRLREIGEEEREYIFKHVITQDVTYSSLLLAQRKTLHQVAGEAIEALFPDRLDELAETLAYHYERAERTEKAVACLRRAGERAVRLSANEEAIAHLNRGLELLQTLPDTPERSEQELAMQIHKIGPLMAIQGYGAPETGRASARARELCQRLGDSPQFFSAQWLLGSFYLARAEHRTALELMEEVFAAARRHGDPLQISLCHWGLGLESIYLGEFASAQSHLEHTIAFYDPRQHGTLCFTCGQDPGVSCLAWASWALWFLGYPDQAWKRSREALALAQELHHPFTLGFALGIAGIMFHQLRRESKAVREHLERSIRLSTEEGLTFLHDWGTFIQGKALADQGMAEEGIAQMRRSLAIVDASGTKMHRPHLLSLLAEVQAEIGQIDEGLATVAEGLAGVETTGECYVEAELHRLKGELLLMQGQAAEAEASLLRAIDVARRQQAKSWELRAVTSLSRLWQKHAKHVEARRRLAETYGWFTEGFDTPDLKEAKALLDELGA